MKDRNKVKDFWDQQAAQGVAAGTRDLIAKELETRAITSHAADGMRVLDAGCGNGVTALALAARLQVDIDAFDYSAKMIEAARESAASASLRGTVRFFVSDLTALEGVSGPYDLVYTERSLINLPDWEAQCRAITGLLGLLKPGGAYVMCENSLDGLEEVNQMRVSLGLSRVDPPWHNRYLRDAEVNSLRVPGCVLEGVDCFSSTYFLLSRVVNAWLCAREGKEPQYDAPINQLALKLPAIGKLGQTRIWRWRRQDRGGS